MGIIRAIRQTIGGTLADQWLEVIEPENMGDQTVLTAGIRTGKERTERVEKTVSLMDQ